MLGVPYPVFSRAPLVSNFQRLTRPSTNSPYPDYQPKVLVKILDMAPLTCFSEWRKWDICKFERLKGVKGIFLGHYVAHYQSQKKTSLCGGLFYQVYVNEWSIAYIWHLNVITIKKLGIIALNCLTSFVIKTERRFNITYVSSMSESN